MKLKIMNFLLTIRRYYILQVKIDHTLGSVTWLPKENAYMKFLRLFVLLIPIKI